MKIIQIKVKPNARASALEEQSDGTWKAKLKSPPVDGKANEELISLVAAHFGLRASQVLLKRGTSNRTKWVQLNTQP